MIFHMNLREKEMCHVPTYAILYRYSSIEALLVGENAVPCKSIVRQHMHRDSMCCHSQHSDRLCR